MATTPPSRIGQNPLNAVRSDSLRQAVRGIPSEPIQGLSTTPKETKTDAIDSTEKSALLDLVRSGVELQGPQSKPSPEVARLAYHLDRIATELATVRERLSHTRGALDSANRTEEYLQKYVDKFEAKSDERINKLEAQVNELSEKYLKANMRIGELKNAVQVLHARNKQLKVKLAQTKQAMAPHRGFFSRILNPKVDS